jgi:hypothetical protein
MMITKHTRRALPGMAIASAVLGALLVPGAALAAAPDTTAPTTPADLRVQNLSFTEATLAWSPSSDNSGWTMYTVEIKAPGDLQRYGATESRRTFTALTQGRTYTASVLAVDSARNESAAVSIQFTTPVDTQAPGAPTDLQVSGPGGASNVITWDASADNSDRLVYTVFAESQPVYRTTELSVGVIDLVNTCVLAPGSTHQLTIQTRDVGSNLSPHSAPVTVTLPG